MSSYYWWGRSKRKSLYKPFHSSLTPQRPPTPKRIESDSEQFDLDINAAPELFCSMFSVWAKQCKDLAELEAAGDRQTFIRKRAKFFYSVLGQAVLYYHLNLQSYRRHNLWRTDRSTAGDATDSMDSIEGLENFYRETDS
jgi:hypothetical protein